MTKANLHYEHALRECSLIIAERGKQVNEYTEFLEGLKKELKEWLADDWPDSQWERVSAYGEIIEQIQQFQSQQNKVSNE